MNYGEAVTKLAMYYDEPPFIDKKPNIKLTVLHDYFEDNFIEGDRIGQFVDYVIRKFEPTSAHRFPVLARIEELHGEFRAPDEKAFIEYDFNTAVKEFADNNTYPMTTNTPATEIDKDVKNLNAAEMMKKYGIKRAGEAWLNQGARMSDEEYTRYKTQRRSVACGY